MGTLDAVNICAVVCMGFAIRAIISLHPYSGKGDYSMFGDYEAQRHWQEITINLPISDWYKNTSDNDLMYWGLDYPPLTAYHSWILGKFALKCNKEFVELHKSRGYESKSHKNFMRTTVLLADLFIYIPAALLAVATFAKFKKEFSTRLSFVNAKIDHLLIFLLYPGQVLIDNGHFQYNNISLGLTLFALTSILLDKHLLASLAFCLALNYKQMELYHSLPFFVYLLKISMKDAQKRYFQSFITIAKIGTVVIVTFTLLWLPWIISSEVLSVIHRIFPIARGVFEDKVSNFWCVLNNFIKIKQIFSNGQMALICFCSTLLSCIPSCLHLFLYPDKLTFVYALLNCSLGFFLFSYQVHEKSVLLPALPALLLFPVDPFAISWFLQITTFSMFPLLHKDGLTISYASTSMIFYLICNLLIKEDSSEKKNSKNLKLLMQLSYAIGILLVVCHLCVPTLNRLPHLYPVLISFYSFTHFILFKIYFNYKLLCRR